MLSFTAARQQLADLAHLPAEVETVALNARSAPQLYGRVLASPAHALLDQPDAPRSRMDGYAVRYADLADGTPLPVAGLSRAGEAAGQLPPATAWRIYTGAVLPKHADTVIAQEETSITNTDPLQMQWRKPNEMPTDWIRQPGEDFQRGQLLLSAGTQLHERHLVLLASAGCTELNLYRKIRIATLRLGGELTAMGTKLPAGGQYDLNGLLLSEAMRNLNTEIEDVGIVPDQLDTTCEALLQAAASCDLIVTTGGASVGDEDFVSPALKKLGKRHFRGVAMRPGMPFTAGTINGTLLLALPGNPVSVFVTFHLLALPLIRRLQGATEVDMQPFRARLEEAVDNPSERQLFLQSYCYSKQGEMRVRAMKRQHSALLMPLAQANCALELKPHQRKKAGASALIWPYGNTGKHLPLPR